jgi:hypothetical protein
MAAKTNARASIRISRAAPRHPGQLARAAQQTPANARLHKLA